MTNDDIFFLVYHFGWSMEVIRNTDPQVIKWIIERLKHE